MKIKTKFSIIFAATCITMSGMSYAKTSIVVSVVVSIILFIVGFIMIVSIINPLKSLTEHVDTIAEGNWGVKIVVTSKDEIGELSRSFNTMTDKLFKSQEEIEERAVELGKVNVQLQYEVAVREQTEENLKNTQAQLVHSEKLAGIGQLAAGIAHEINNPIGYVLGNSETLSDYFKSLQKFIKHYESATETHDTLSLKKELDIDYILGDVESLLRDNVSGLHRVVEIVANLKDFARIGQKTDHLEADLELNIESTLMVARNEIKYHVEVKTEFGKISPVFCNIGELNQVFLNIIVNSAQAISNQNRPEKGLITISTREDESFVYCAITDNGLGISEENKKRIFEAFFTTKPVGQGTGLGLNIAWDIVVNKHKGELTVESELGKGACFTIKLPKHSAKDA